MLKHMVCQHCNKGFIAIRPNQKYCCKKCRLTACESRRECKKPKNQHRYNPKTGQMCWRCRNATDMNRCPWSIGILPKGCVTKRVIREPEERNTYKILYCPIFNEDDY